MVKTETGTTKRLPRHLRHEDIPSHTFTPRTYQVELLDAALQRNTIVCLGSSAGNTFISVMLLKEFSSELRKELQNEGKRSVVCLSSNDAIQEMSQVIKHHSDLGVVPLPEMLEDKSKLRKLLNDHQILVTKPSVFKDLLLQNILLPAQLSLVILENCHLILQEDHPYQSIMKKINDSVPKSSSPRILGLTSSFISQKCQDPGELESIIKSLEDGLCARAETATLVIAERYGIRPKENLTYCDNYEDETGTLTMLDDVLTNALDFLKECNMEDEEDDDRDPKDIPIFVFTECLNILYTLGPWCASCIASMFINQIEKVDKHETVPIHKKFLRYCLTQLRIVNTLFEQNFTPNYDVEELLQYSTPRVYELINHLRKYKPEYDFMIVSSGGDMDGFMGGGEEGGRDGDSEDDESEMSDDSMIMSDEETSDRSYKGNVLHIAVKRELDSESQQKTLDPLNLDNEKYLCGIVFVDHRYVALAINKFLEEVCSWDENLCFVKSQHLTGQGLKDKKSKKGGWKKQEEVLRKFRLQDLNLLVSTTVLEDGIDVPKCNLIVKFDPPRTYKSYSQSKGRARARDSEYVILVEENRREAFIKDYNVFKGIESVLVGRRNEGEELEDEDHPCEELSSLLLPYIPNADNPQICVTMDTAIAFVNRYCAKLPSDAFTHLTPKCSMLETLGEEGTFYTATLSLPINSPYKHPIQGEPMPTKNLAKRAVALKLCECLHKAGELDDQLNPVGKEVFSLEEEEEMSEVEDGEDFSGEGRPGTTKRKQYYFKKLASSLLKSHPTTEKRILYSITLNLSKPISDEQNTRGRKICAPEETSRGFGILTSKQIPQVPTFPVYTRSGEVTASIDLLSSYVPLSEEELRRLREFHRFTFTNVLRLEKDPMEFCPEESELGYLIVPLNKEDESKVIIDWDFVKEVEDSKSHIRRNIYDSKREQFIFSKESYEDAVVMPSYRNVDQPQHFYVAEIRADLNPSSPFPSPELYKTFSAYYTTKYGLTITNQDQPLLDVDHTSARLNLLTPRYMNQKGVALPTSSAETKKARRENLQQKQILVPELCEIHVFPASLWRKAVCLPTILYRLNYLLVADEIRVKIAEGTGIGMVKLEEGFRFQPLDFGFDPKEEMEEGEGSNGAMNNDVNNDSDEMEDDLVKEKTMNGCDSQTSSHIDCDSTGLFSSEKEGDTKKASCDTKQNINAAFQNEKAANDNCDIQNNMSDNSKHGKNGFLKNNEEWGKTLQDQSSCKCWDKVQISDKSLNELTAELNEMNIHITNSPSKNNPHKPILTDFPDVGVFQLSEKQSKVSPKTEDSNVDVNFPVLSISLDEEVDLSTFVGPSPCTILQALTMSNANDFFSLERLETIGDSFLKYAITVYLYCTYPGIHEGKLSYLRSKQVSNCNLYRLGKRKGFAECMISTKFEPYENWLPSGYVINDDKRKGPVPKVLLIRNDLGQLEKVKESSIIESYCQENATMNWVPKLGDVTDDPNSKTVGGGLKSEDGGRNPSIEDEEEFESQLRELEALPERVRQEERDQVVIPYNLQTLHSIPDKSIADCVESLIGCYLTSCGKKAVLKFMHWLGLKVLPQKKKGSNEEAELLSLQCPESPLLTHVPGYNSILCRLLEGYDMLEQKIGYEFKDKSYLLQAFTHASYHYNTVTDCYQRLEFLGDAILDYVITRHLYEDSCKYSPGVLTDLRSALVNNNIFAALAVKWDFHKYFKAISPPLFGVMEKFVARQKEREDEIDLSDDEGEGEDEEHVELEVPKALGDIFESLAGAIYLDSGMSLDTVWRVYYRIMKPQIDKYLKSIPKSPVRELLEMEPETAKFEKPERTLEGKIRVTVNVVTKGVFTGVGRNYRIAKSAAAKKALRSIRAMQAGGLI
ncbi:endoribonuclease Dicer-like [Saccostrea cucullata]|uniref:endoribonuclease Dicer-like n=1 Tax=Saccostrea cuccullata TaxID=36930 RepID=UPI002ED496DF